MLRVLRRDTQFLGKLRPERRFHITHAKMQFEKESEHSHIKSHFRNNKKKYVALASALSVCTICTYAYNQSDYWMARFARTLVSVTRIMILFRSFNQKYKKKREEFVSNKGDEWDSDNEFVIEYAEARKNLNHESAKIILELCIVNKGAYVKAGQFIASLVYALPKEITDVLSALQDAAPTHDWEYTRVLLEEQFGTSFNELFVDFDEKPLASASIAQVHVARLRENNEKVAIKIQHPRLREIFEQDVLCMTMMLKLAKFFYDFPFAWVMPEFEKSLQNELDFVNEAINCERATHMFRNNKQIIIPSIYWDLTSEKIITMEFLDGFRLNDMDQLAKNNISVKQVSQLLVDCYSVQTFLYGNVHSDLHPGNLHVRIDPKSGLPQLIVLDHGCYKRLDEQVRLDYANMWRCIINRDINQGRVLLEKFGIDGDFFQLFALFLTFSNLLDKSETGLIDQRKKMDGNQIKSMFASFKDKYLSKHPNAGITDYFALIEGMLQGMNLDLVLLLKANIQVRGITSGFNKPINRFATMVEYCIHGSENQVIQVPKIIPLKGGKSRVIHVDEVRLSEGTFIQRFKLNWQLLKLRFNLLVMDLLFSMRNNAFMLQIFKTFYRTE
ncbi:aarF domain-containing protein kinase [Acrasis kona]|uniref:AarF domain-containing protein kinase n=1 Tax=Acrasis kona TaxID=1008807 RepID=A0AAW2ZLW8_9EUKA